MGICSEDGRATALSGLTGHFRGALVICIDMLGFRASHCSWTFVVYAWTVVARRVMEGLLFCCQALACLLAQPSKLLTA